jgi:integrase
MTEQLAIQAYRNFCDTCKSPETRIGYIKSLRYFMTYLQIEPERYDQLLEKDAVTTQMNIVDYIRFLRKDHSSGTVAVYLAAIRKFYQMNDVILNWDKIHSFEGEQEKQSEDRPYTHSEIHSLIDRTSLRNKAIILLMASSGPRVGALPSVRIKDLEPIDKYNIYKITYYPKSKKFRYSSFCTPECRQAIDDYLEHRRRFGERLEPDTALFRREFDSTGGHVTNPRPIQTNTIGKMMDNLLRKVGIRSSFSLETEKHKRHEVMMDHGFRKFYETNAFKAGMDREYIRRLLGQKGGRSALEDAYLKLSEDELLEGDSRHTGFIGIINQLTIDDTHRLKREVQILKIEKSKMERLEQKIAEFDRVLGLS